MIRSCLASLLFRQVGILGLKLGLDRVELQLDIGRHLRARRARSTIGHVETTCGRRGHSAAVSGVEGGHHCLGVRKEMLLRYTVDAIGTINAIDGSRAHVRRGVGLRSRRALVHLLLTLLRLLTLLLLRLLLLLLMRLLDLLLLRLLHVGDGLTLLVRDATGLKQQVDINFRLGIWHWHPVLLLGLHRSLNLRLRHSVHLHRRHKTAHLSRCAAHVGCRSLHRHAATALAWNGKLVRHIRASQVTIDLGSGGHGCGSRTVRLHLSSAGSGRHLGSSLALLGTLCL